MASKRAGVGPTDATTDGEDRAAPWSDFQRVLDQMFGLLEGVHQGDVVPASGVTPRRTSVTGGGTR
ncbi:hypothetical protein OG239_04485 [Streptomyces sp. NBC_00868]|uniref:hypothetical protein n=1 Tax=unclassified Streptomyces TaxID=2593676 RepID=UPI0032565B79|nr:hypothetical protein OG239_04485 [Streptomyces sp. NBC_00868]